jgi:hypothetical protein
MSMDSLLLGNFFTLISYLQVKHSYVLAHKHWTMVDSFASGKHTSLFRRKKGKNDFLRFFVPEVAPTDVCVSTKRCQQSGF